MSPLPQSIPHGWLILDKPLGLTSTQALGRVRRLVGGKKAGHGGTLDPLATGLLPLAFGEATKLIPYVMEGTKTYEFSVRWGEARTTDDSEGEISSRSDRFPTEEQIQATIPNFTGKIQQKPPAYSAIKLGGERAYDLARSGQTVDLAPREVEIHNFELVQVIDSKTACFRVSCGKGMYVRSLARDLAVKLGTVGYVASLKRTKVGPFTLKNAVSMENLEALSLKNEARNVLLPIKSALWSIPTLNLSPNEANSLRLGQKILIRPQNVSLIEHSLLFAEHDGVPIALVKPHAGQFQIVRGFFF